MDAAVGSLGGWIGRHLAVLDLTSYAAATFPPHLASPSPCTASPALRTACLQVMYRLDGVDPEVRSYFSPVAKMVLASRNPQEAMEVSGCACGCWGRADFK